MIDQQKILELAEQAGASITEERYGEVMRPWKISFTRYNIVTFAILLQQKMLNEVHSVKRTSDQSIELVFSSCRAAS